MTRLVREADAQRDSRLLREFAASGISVGCANTFLNPVEVVKTRMQLAGASSSSSAAAAAARPAAAAAAHSSTTFSSSMQPSAARFISHSTSAAASATAQATALNPTAAGYRPYVFPQQAATAAANAGTTSAEQALAAAANSINNSSAATVARRPGFLATAGLIMRQEGFSGFTRGIQATTARAVCNGGIRLGLYDPIKTLISTDGTGRDLHVGQKLLAGSISGGIGAVLTTPIELVKTRLQAPNAATRSPSEVLKSVILQQGVTGLWRGATPSVLRLILLNGSMVATYDEVKGRIMRLTGWTGGVNLVLSSSMVAGLVTTTAINPADVIRAYMQTGRGSSLTGIAKQIYEREGLRGFMKGWTAAYCRTGPQTLIIFTVSEIVRPLFGLNVIGSC